tara:strand:- start:315 stop:734 length:420 start_codon:yes stop_codon:yes gene_type:complete
MGTAILALLTSFVVLGYARRIVQSRRNPVMVYFLNGMPETNVRFLYIVSDKGEIQIPIKGGVETNFRVSGLYAVTSSFVSPSIEQKESYNEAPFIECVDINGVTQRIDNAWGYTLMLSAFPLKTFKEVDDGVGCSFLLK